MIAPFAKIVVPAVVGVAAARIVVCPMWAAAVCAAVVLGTAAVLARGYKHAGMRSLYVWMGVAFFFFAMGTARRPRAEIPQGVRLEMVAQVAERPIVHGRWQTGSARVGWWRAAPLRGEPEGQWHRVHENIRLSIDTCYTVEIGERIAFRGYLNGFEEGGFARLMALRGTFGRVYLVPNNLTGRGGMAKTPAVWAARLQARMVERLEHLQIDSASLGVVTAMSAGWRGGIDTELRADYSKSGAAHLLAVSGLHVGIVFVLVNVLIYSIIALVSRLHGRVPRHHLVVRGVIAVAAIWAYAAASGLAPSVIRAALMFSFAQLAVASGTRRDALNILLGSAVVMLALNPNWWGDAGFMMSYAAVLSIVLFFEPLYSRLRTRFKAVNVLISIMIVGFAATLGTAPLTAYYFGQVPISGLLINPVVIATAHVIVMLGVVWMVAPVWAAGFSAALGWAARVQNDVVEWSAGLSWASVDVGQVPLWAVLAAYAGIGALAWAATSLRGAKRRGNLKANRTRKRHPERSEGSQKDREEILRGVYPE